MFDFFRKVLKIFGFKFYEYKEESNCEQVEEGIRIAREYEDIIYEDLLMKEKRNSVDDGQAFEVYWKRSQKKEETIKTDDITNQKRKEKEPLLSNGGNKFMSDMLLEDLSQI